jgi:hypothetical protein
MNRRGRKRWETRIQTLGGEGCGVKLKCSSEVHKRKAPTECGFFYWQAVNMHGFKKGGFVCAGYLSFKNQKVFLNVYKSRELKNF